jgi:hypothetical protein
MNTRTLARLIFSFAVPVVLTACPADSANEPGPQSEGQTGAAGSADLELERMTVEKLKACRAYEPLADPKSYSVEDELDRCAARCFLDASCEAIQTFACGGDELALIHCAEACDSAPADGFRCSDGTRIAHAALCDQFEDCPNGEDEKKCGEYRCSDGEVIPAAGVRCDWIEDCGDGSDERGCAIDCS